VARWRGGAVARWRGGAVARWRGGAVARWRGGAVARWDRPYREFVTPIRIRSATAADTSDPALAVLLREAVDEARVADTVRAAVEGGACLVADDAGRIVGCVCVSRAEGDRWTITAVAVAANHRRTGIGRDLVTEAVARLGAGSLGAETDRDAVDFYRRLGFVVTSLGEKYPGVERFACRWEA